jgi:hypothetical protein
LNQYCISQPHPCECKTFFSFFIVFSHNLLLNSKVKHLETFPNLNLLLGAFSLDLKDTCHIHFETLIKWEEPFHYPSQDFIVWYDDWVITKFVNPKFVVLGPKAWIHRFVLVSFLIMHKKQTLLVSLQCQVLLILIIIIVWFWKLKVFQFWKLSNYVNNLFE